LEDLEILPSRKNARKLRREHSSRRINWRKEIWTVGFHVQERAPEEAHGKK
jgi:hypothetical protein